MKDNNNEENFEKNEIEEEDEVETVPKLMSVAIGYRPAQIVREEPFEMKVKENYATTWNTGNIPVASSNYRRSRTVFEVTGERMSKVADIVFNSNKARSIHADYDDDGATVKCKTSSYLKFTIRLLHPADNADVVLVDVRRLSGCAMAFRDEYQAIYQTVLHGKSFPPKVQTSFADLDFMQDMYIPLEKGIIERSLEMSMVNLESKMYDTRIITLQDLLLTTDPDSKETSSTACKLIVEKYSKILEYVVEDILKRIESADIDDDDSEEYLRSLSLKLLGNVLNSENTNLSLISLEEKNNWAHKLIDSLIWYVGMAKDYPWNACLAARCLRLLAPNFKIQEASDGKLLALDVLENAEKYGKNSYMLLEHEAHEAILVLDPFYFHASALKSS